MDLVASVVTMIFGWVGDVASTIAGNALLLIPLAITLTGAAIGFGMRLMGTRKGRRR